MNGTGHLPYSGTGQSDDNLGGALLTPIPWLVNGTSRPRTGSLQSNADTHTANGVVVNDVDEAKDEDAEMTTIEEQLREEGSITQGELLRREQEASDPPAPVGSTASTGFTLVTSTSPRTEDTVANGMTDGDKDETTKDVAAPVEGPTHIGAEDIGSQEPQTGAGQVLDIGAAVGRAPATEGEVEEVKAEMAGIGLSEAREQKTTEQDTEMADAEKSLVQENTEKPEGQSNAAAEDQDIAMD